MTAESLTNHIMKPEGDTSAPQGADTPQDADGGRTGNDRMRDADGGRTGAGQVREADGAAVRPLYVDRLLRACAENYAEEIVWAVLVLGSILLRIFLIPAMQSEDYYYCLLPWVEEYRAFGVAGGLARTIGNYYVPYNLFLAFCSVLPVEPYIPIGFLSCAADYGCAYAIYRLVRQLYGRGEVLPLSSGMRGFAQQADGEGDAAERNAQRAFVLTLYLPTVFLNSAVWKQCDAIYFFFLLLSLSALLEDRPGRAFFLLSVSFVFKLQAVIFLPFCFLVYLIKKNVSLLHFLWLPGMYLLTGLPAVFAGRPAAEVYKTYFLQTTENERMTLNLPNIYSLVMGDYYAFKKAAILLTILILTAGLSVIYRKRDSLTLRHLSGACIWSVFTCLMFLPAMHERYDYPVLLLMGIHACTFRDKWAALCAAVLCGCDLITYSWFLVHYAGIEIRHAALAFCGVYLYLTYRVFLSEKLSWNSKTP